MNTLVIVVLPPLLLLHCKCTKAQDETKTIVTSDHHIHSGPLGHIPSGGGIGGGGGNRVIMQHMFYHYPLRSHQGDPYHHDPHHHHHDSHQDSYHDHYGHSSPTYYHSSPSSSTRSSGEPYSQPLRSGPSTTIFHHSMPGQQPPLPLSSPFDLPSSASYLHDDFDAPFGPALAAALESEAKNYKSFADDDLTKVIVRRDKSKKNTYYDDGDSYRPVKRKRKQLKHSKKYRRKKEYDSEDYEEPTNDYNDEEDEGSLYYDLLDSDSNYPPKTSGRYGSDKKRIRKVIVYDVDELDAARRRYG